MYAHLEPQVTGWWSGVLHPMEAPEHLVTMLVVGLLGGLAVRAGRSSFTLPALFAVGLLSCGLIGVSADWGFDNQATLFALAAVLIVMVFISSRVTTVVAPIVVLTAGALHGFAHSIDADRAARPVGYVAGFVFTTGLLLAVGAIFGAAIGHGLNARRPAAGASRSSVDDAIVDERSPMSAVHR